MLDSSNVRLKWLWFAVCLYAHSIIFLDVETVNSFYFFADVSKSMSARQKLEAQLTENNIVKEVRTQLQCIFHICILICGMLQNIPIYLFMMIMFITCHVCHPSVGAWIVG